MRTKRSYRSRTVATLVLLVLAHLTAAGDAVAQELNVPESMPSKCKKDAASRIQAWIDSAPDGATLRFERRACYRVERTLEFRNRWLTFDGNGATFKSFKRPDDQRAMWRAWNSNVTFTSMTLVGSYARGGRIDHNLQHAHGIDLRGTDATITRVEMSDLAGDCVYFGLGVDGSSGYVADTRCRRISRNAVSVTAGNDIRVTGMRATKIGHIVFDIEPNMGSSFGASSVTFDSNVIIEPYWLMAFTVIANEPVSDVAFTNNRIIGQAMKIGVVNESYRPRNVTISNNSSDTGASGPAMNIHGVDGITVSGNDVPLNGGPFAVVNDSCGVDVSGNAYAGGASEAAITSAPC